MWKPIVVTKFSIVYYRFIEFLIGIVTKFGFGQRQHSKAHLQFYNYLNSEFYISKNGCHV